MNALAFAAIFMIGAIGAGHAAGIERLYVLDCGESTGKDQARWSPGVNEGKPIEFSDNCYLIKHQTGLFLWDTGIPDAVVDQPNGVSAGGGAIVYRRTKTLAAQLAAIGVDPNSVGALAVSHTHGDHVGNVGMFAKATVYLQAAEYDWAYGNGAKPPFAPTQVIRKLEGDHDVFGDGSVVILSTPGHTPGHQSLLVNLPKTGAVVMSGDAVHFRDNWENRRAPAINFDRARTLASLQKIETVMKERNAALWINHDKPQSDAIPHSPAYLE